MTLDYPRLPVGARWSDDVSLGYSLRPVVVMSEYDTLLPMPSCRNLLTKAIAATHAPSIVPAGLTGSGGGEVCAK